ncbi:MAG: mechanosensitive ion channel family protein [Patescibacteria group bacterium]|nr:mechanosensitive ion channel family protein [Patescibacteria group bacterium]
MALQDLLLRSFLGNSISQLLIYIAILIAAFIGSKIVYFLFSKVFMALTKKTETRLDDLLVEALQGPVVLMMIIIGLFYGGSFLTMTEQFSSYYFRSVTALIIFNIAWFISRILNSFLENYLQPAAKKKSAKATDTLFPLLKKIFNFIIFSIALLLILEFFGVKINGLIAGLGIGGLAFALAAQDVLANMFGGAAVLTDKPFHVGDRILVEGQDGIVKKIGLRSTVMETFDGTHIIIPNKRVADSVLENISREKARRIKITLGVEYGTKSAKMMKAKTILSDIVKKNKSTRNNSLIHFLSFGDSSLNMQLIYWITDIDMIFQAQDEINFEIKKAFEKEKIEFAFPSQTVYVKK